MEITFENLKRSCEVEEILIENLMRWKALAQTRQCKNIDRHNTRESCAIMLWDESVKSW